MVSAEDNQRAPRVKVDLKAHLQLGTRFIREVVANLSMSGLYLRTRERTRPGTPVRMALALPDVDGPRYCTVHGSVARVERDGIGVRFAREELADQDLRLLESFVARLLPEKRIK